MDPLLFFGILFGSEQCERYIGKLYLAMQTNQVAKELQRGPSEKVSHATREKKNEKQLQQRQFLREVRCALHLRSLLDQWAVRRDAIDFTKSISHEASLLARCSFGSRLLSAIGQAYQSSAEEFMSGLYGPLTLEAQLTRLSSSFQDTHMKTAVGLSLAKAAYAANAVCAEAAEAVAAASTEWHASGDGVSESDSAAKSVPAQRGGCFNDSLEGKLPVFLQTLWDVCLLDITSTLKNVSGKVLKDVSVPWQLRLRRCQALLHVARSFQAHGACEDRKVAVPDAKRLLEDALMGRRSSRSRADSTES